jgi:hypothetical protein
MNKSIAQYLRHYVSFTQKNWAEYLPLAEFAMRNTVNASTGISPFFANNGYHPRLSFSSPRPRSDLSQKNIDGQAFALKMQQILSQLRTDLLAARDQMESSSNANRQPAPAYRIGDLVLLSTKNITSPRPIPKFDAKYIGPFRVIQIINSHSYKLQLPSELDSIHPVFHTNLLRPAAGTPLPGQYNPPPPPIAIDESGETLWAIEKILNSRRRGGKFQYLIRWRGYNETHDSWEPLSNVINAHQSIRQYEKDFANKPSPTKVERQKALKEHKKVVDVSVEPHI